VPPFEPPAPAATERNKAADTPDFELTRLPQREHCSFRRALSMANLRVLVSLRMTSSPDRSRRFDGGSFYPAFRKIGSFFAATLLGCGCTDGQSGFDKAQFQKTRKPAKTARFPNKSCREP